MRDTLYAKSVFLLLQHNVVLTLIIKILVLYLLYQKNKSTHQLNTELGGLACPDTHEYK